MTLFSGAPRPAAWSGKGPVVRRSVPAVLDGGAALGSPGDDGEARARVPAQCGEARIGIAGWVSFRGWAVRAGCTTGRIPQKGRVFEAVEIRFSHRARARVRTLGVVWV